MGQHKHWDVPSFDDTGTVYGSPPVSDLDGRPIVRFAWFDPVTSRLPFGIAYLFGADLDAKAGQDGKPRKHVRVKLTTSLSDTTLSRVFF